MNALNPLMTSPMATLVRREFWEHRALWIAPLVVAALLLFGVIASTAVGHDSEWYFHFGGMRPIGQAALGFVILSFTVPQYLVMLISLFFYLLDCLYTERKDRSILFWKSMPVSDTRTVLSKVLVALAVVPLGVFLLTVVTDLVVAVIMAIGLKGGSPFWDTLTWLKLRGAMIVGLATLLLWFSPIAGYLLLVSAWARRNVFLWATLPPLLLLLVENRAFGTSYVATVLKYRLSGVWQHFGSDLATYTWQNGAAPGFGHLLDSAGAMRAWLDADLWVGVAVAAVFVYAAIRIRGYRDDT